MSLFCDRLQFLRTHVLYQLILNFFSKVLTGDIGEASRTFYNYYQVWKQYGATPEFYHLVNNKVFPKREGYPLRPGMTLLQ